MDIWEQRDLYGHRYCIYQVETETHVYKTHPSALALPSYHRILVKHGLIEKTLSIPKAYEVFLKVGVDPEVQKLRRKVAEGDKIKHVPALYQATAMALQGMTKRELDALKLRIEEKPIQPHEAP